MIKKSNITSNVMKRIVGVEKKNLLRKLIVFLSIFASLFVVFAVVSVLFIQDVKDLGTWDVLTLFWEDREIIADFWVEALSTFWLEVPTYYLYILLAICIISWIVFYTTRERRTSFRQRREKLASYEKSGTLLKRRQTT